MMRDGKELTILEHKEKGAINMKKVHLMTVVEKLNHDRRVRERDAQAKLAKKRLVQIDSDEIAQAMLDNGQRPFIANR